MIGCTKEHGQTPFENGCIVLHAWRWIHPPASVVAASSRVPGAQIRRLSHIIMTSGKGSSIRFTLDPDVSSFVYVSS
jgi:hypothetical protein